MSEGDGLVARYVRILVAHNRTILVGFLLVSLLIATGVLVGGTQFQINQFEVSSDEQRAADQVQAQFPTDDHSYSQIVIQSNDEVNDTVEREHLLETLELQKRLRSDETVNATLAPNQQTIGVANAIAIATDPRIGFAGSPSIDLQIGVLEDRSNAMNRRVLGNLLDDPTSSPEGQPPVSALLEKGYDPATDNSEARLIILVHDESVSETDLLAAQEHTEHLAEEHVTADTFVMGQELAFDRGATATGESFQLIGPVIVVLVFALLAVAYRDLFDILVSATGIGLVILWTAGLTGWLGIEFSQLLVAVPCLLAGLSIDYALHVVMRYREAVSSAESRSVDLAMRRGLAAVLLAIGATTATTAAGFLSGLISPIGILRDFGVVTALGVLSALIVFGTFVPALKLERERRRSENKIPQKRSIGAISPFGTVLDVCATVATRIPAVIIGLAILLAIAGAMGATGMETSTDRSDFLPEAQQPWMQSLPEELRPTDYGLREQSLFIEETFESPTEPTVDILITGNVTAPETLDRINEAAQAANQSETSVRPADGTKTVRSPLDAIAVAAKDDEQLAAVLEAVESSNTSLQERMESNELTSQETGDKWNESDLNNSLVWVFDAAFEAADETAADTINRSESGDYHSLRLVVTVDREATPANVTGEMRASAAIVDASQEVDAIATGHPILEYIQQRAILETVLGTLLLAMVVITAGLTVLFRRWHGSWILGPITILPVLLAVAWLLGTMAAFDIPFNAETGLLTAIAIGLGTDYTIHVSERYVQERESHNSHDSMTTTLVETGSVVFVSATTTAAGFAVLMLTVIPSLQRFGLVTALAVIFAFVASVTVLPSLLGLWENRR